MLDIALEEVEKENELWLEHRFQSFLCWILLWKLGLTVTIT